MKTANDGAGETISKYQVERFASILRLRQPTLRMTIVFSRTMRVRWLLFSSFCWQRKKSQALRMTFVFHRLNETAVVLVAFRAAVSTEFVFTFIKKSQALRMTVLFLATQGMTVVLFPFRAAARTGFVFTLLENSHLTIRGLASLNDAGGTVVLLCARCDRGMKPRENLIRLDLR